MRDAQLEQRAAGRRRIRVLCGPSWPARLSLRLGQRVLGGDQVGDRVAALAGPDQGDDPQRERVRLPAWFVDRARHPDAPVDGVQGLVGIGRVMRGDGAHVLRGGAFAASAPARARSAAGGCPSAAPRPGCPTGRASSPLRSARSPPTFRARDLPLPRSPRATFVLVQPAVRHRDQQLHRYSFGGRGIPDAQSQLPRATACPSSAPRSRPRSGSARPVGRRPSRPADPVPRRTRPLPIESRHRSLAPVLPADLPQPAAIRPRGHARRCRSRSSGSSTSMASKVTARCESRAAVSRSSIARRLPIPVNGSWRAACHSASWRAEQVMCDPMHAVRRSARAAVPSTSRGHRTRISQACNGSELPGPGRQLRSDLQNQHHGRGIGQRDQVVQWRVRPPPTLRLHLALRGQSPCQVGARRSPAARSRRVC